MSRDRVRVTVDLEPHVHESLRVWVAQRGTRREFSLQRVLAALAGALAEQDPRILTVLEERLASRDTRDGASH